MRKELTNKYNIGLSILLAIGMECSSRVCYNGDIFGSYTENYVIPWSPRSVLIVLFLAACSLLVISVAEKILSRLKLPVIEQKLKNSTIIIIWSVLIVLAWLPYYFSYYPGGIYSDTFLSIYYAHGNMLTNRHPFLYNRLIRLFILLRFHYGKSVTWAMGIMLAVQMILLAAEIIWFIYWMLKRNVHPLIRIVSSIYLVFFNLIPLYGVSLWKDTPFCMAILFWMTFVVDLYEHGKDGGKIPVTIVLGFIAGMFLTAFSRNNGAYVCALVVLILCLTMFRQRLAVVASVTAVIVIFVIQGPVYDHFWIAQSDPVLNYPVPLQQIAATVAYDGSITEDEKNIVQQIFHKNDLKQRYVPTDADFLTLDDGVDIGYFNTHISDFLSAWASMLPKNFGVYVRAYLMDTLGFWDPFETSGVAYVQNEMWDNAYEVEQTDLFEQATGLSFQNLVNPQFYISAAVFFWLFLFAAVLGMKHYGNGFSLVYSPLLGVWATVMIATPIAFSLRYVSPMVFCVPFLFIVPNLLSGNGAQETGDLPCKNGKVPE